MDAVDVLDNDVWGLVYARLVLEEDAQARKNMVLSSKRFRTNPCISSQHLTRLPVYEDTTRRDLERSVPLDAHIRHVVVRSAAPRDWKLWYHDRLDDVRRVTFELQNWIGLDWRVTQALVSTMKHFTCALSKLKVLEIPYSINYGTTFEMMYRTEEWNAMPGMRELRIFDPGEWSRCDYTDADVDSLSRVLRKSPQLHTLMLTNLPSTDSVFSCLSAPSSLQTLELQMVTASDICRLQRDTRLLRDRLPGMQRVVVHSLFLQNGCDIDLNHYNESTAAEEYAEIGRALSAAPIHATDDKGGRGGGGFQLDLNEERFTLMGSDGHLIDHSYGPQYHARMLRAVCDGGRSTAPLSRVFSRVRHVRLHKLELSTELASEIDRTFPGAHTVSLVDVSKSYAFDGVSVAEDADVGRVFASLGERTIVASFSKFSGRGSVLFRYLQERGIVEM